MESLILSRFCRCLPIVTCLLFLTSCSENSNDPAPGVSKPFQPVAVNLLQLQTADNCDELKTYFTESLIKQYASIPLNTHYYYCPSPTTDGVGTGAPPTAGSAPVADDANLSGGESSAGTSTNSPIPGDVSDTNNQEQGVHEGDIVKADAAGNIYILTGRHFIIANGFPPQDMSELARIDLGARGLNLFLDKANQRVIILARDDQPYYIAQPVAVDGASLAIYPAPQQEYTTAIFYDVSTPSSPVVIGQIQMKGYFREGRRINNRLHLVSNFYLQPTGLYEDQEFWTLQNEFQNAIYQARCSNSGGDIANDPLVVSTRENLVNKIKSIVDSQDPSTYIPDAYSVSSDGNKESVPYLACTNIHFPEINKTLGLQIVTSVDTDGGNLSASAVVNNSYIAYVSQENLYLADTSQGWWWLMEDSTQPMSQTAIYKFAISGETPQYVATGRVEGYVNNQFSLSEYNGALRVATTQNDFIQTSEQQWQRIQKNHLNILKDNNAGSLEVVGSVHDFAPNENIRSARFLENRGFVVTFRNVDPLFAFDLAKPDDPKLLGELTIPGFSSYIHPYDENHLLTIGRAGGTGGTGVGNGIQLQLIDVSDMTNPVVAHSYTPQMPNGWSWSAAEHDHKAFTFYKPANVLAIPMQIYPSVSTDVFSGIAAYEVSLISGFSELGRVNHADLAYDYYCVGNPDLKPEYLLDCSNNWYVQWAAPRRSIIMTSDTDVYLYSLSDVGLKASSITNLPETLGSLVFPNQPYPWWYFGYYDVAVSEPVPVASASGPVVF